MNGWPVLRLNRLLAPLRFLLCLFGLIILPTTTQAEDGTELRPVRTIVPAKLASILPSDTHVLIERNAIEGFLVALEGEPPDWATVYGQGHHDPGHDERLFNLNRERDAAREENPVLNRRVAFIWPGIVAVRSRNQELCGGGRAGVQFNQLGDGSIQTRGVPKQSARQAERGTRRPDQSESR